MSPSIPSPHSSACDFFEYGMECAQSCACNETNTAQCLATNGTCICQDGWTGDTCAEDVNECQAPTSVDCGSNALCVNSPGSYRCVCEIGFFKTDSACRGEFCRTQAFLYYFRLACRLRNFEAREEKKVFARLWF